MKIIKRIGLVALILLVLLVGAAFAIPYFFKDELVTKVKTLANEQLQDATLDFQGVHLSLFRDFPNLSLGLEGLTVDGLGAFEGVRLAALKELDLTFDLWSVLRSSSPITLRAIHLEEPELHVYVLQNGRTNYDIAKADTTSAAAEKEPETAGDFKLQLEKLTVHQGQILYDDRQAELYLLLNELDLLASGAFTADRYDLYADLEAGALTLRQGGLTYLKQVAPRLEATVAIDNETQTYTLKDNNLQLNQLRLMADGSVQLPDEERVVLDLKLEAPGNSFKELLSLIPNAYLEGYADVQAGGTFSLNAAVNGTYNLVTGAYPPFDLRLVVANGQVQYPDLPLGISDIQADLAVNSPAADLDRMRVDLNRLAVKVGDHPFRAKMLLRTPISDPDLDADIQGTIDLQALNQAFPMGGITTLTGRIEADVQAKARLSAVEADAYDQVDMRGKLQARDIVYRGEGMPPVQLARMDMDFSPQFVALNDTRAQLGRSDLRAEGRIDNILAYFSPEKTMTGRLTLRSGFFDANEWMSESESADEERQKVESLNAEAAEQGEAPSFNRIDFSLDAACDRLAYDTYTLEEAVAKGRISPQMLNVEQLGAKLGDSDFNLSGTLRNLWGYLFGESVLNGEATFTSRRLNLNPFMETGEDAPSSSSDTPATRPIRVPANLQLALDSRIGRLDYDDLTLSNLQGRVLVRDEAVILDGLTASTLDGQIALSGSYASSEPDRPEFDMKLSLEQMSFQKAFNAFNTMQALAPIGRYMDGTFNTSLLMSGVLGPDLSPDLSTLDAEGFLHTLNARVENFKPLIAVGNALQLDYLTEPIPISDTKNWFEVVDGRVEVKPFDVIFKDFTLNVSGRHGLNQDMDYTLKSQIPVEKLTGNAVGAVAAEGMEKLRQEASRLGISLQKQEYVNVAVDLGGSLDRPSVNVRFLGAGGERSLAEEAKAQVGEELEKQKDRLQAEAGKKLEEGKQKAREEMEKAVDSARAVAEEKLEEIQEEAKEKIKSEVGDKAADILGEEAQKQVDQLLGDSSKSVETIKEELDKWNPFKKKKKKDNN